MKEKLSVPMIMSVFLMLLVLVITLAYPELFISTSEAKGFANGISAALVCCATGFFACFKHNKNSSSK